MEISKIDQKNINNDENLPIFTQGGGGPFHLKTLFENHHPSVKKRNPEGGGFRVKFASGQVTDIPHDGSAWTYRSVITHALTISKDCHIT